MIYTFREGGLFDTLGPLVLHPHHRANRTSVNMLGADYPQETCIKTGSKSRFCGKTYNSSILEAAFNGNAQGVILKHVIHTFW